MQLYKISFKTTDKCYIGITSKTAEIRFKEHCNAKSLISKAIKKYGAESTILTVIGECNDWELLCLSEIEAIEKYNTKNPNGYNLTDGGDGVLGLMKTEEQNNAQSIRVKKHFEDNPEKALQISDTLKEYYANNPEENSRRQKQRYSKEEERLKASERTKKYLDENPQAIENHKQKMIDYYSNPEAREKVSQKNFERFSTEESRANHSKSMKKRFVDNPCLYDVLSIKAKEYFSKQENRDNMSAIKKQQYIDNPVLKVRASVCTLTNNAIKKELPLSLIPKDYFNV
jgi:hypothetical protein